MSTSTARPVRVTAVPDSVRARARIDGLHTVRDRADDTVMRILHHRRSARLSRFGTTVNVPPIRRDCVDFGDAGGAKCAGHASGADSAPPQVSLGEIEGVVGPAKHRCVIQVCEQQLDAERVEAELDEALDGGFSKSQKFVAADSGHRLARGRVVAVQPVKAQEQALVGNRQIESRRAVGKRGQAGACLGEDVGVGKEHDQRMKLDPPRTPNRRRVLWTRCAARPVRNLPCCIGPGR